MQKIISKVKMRNHGVENRAAMATNDTLYALFFQNLVLQYILVKVATFGDYYLKYQEPLERLNRREHFESPSPTWIVLEWG